VRNSPSITVHELTDFEDFSCLFGAWGGRFQQTSRGRFKGSAITYQGKRVSAFRAETNQAIFTRGLDNTEMVTVIPITEANETTSWRGREITRGHLLVKGPYIEYYNQTSRNTVINALLVPLQVFTQIVGPQADIMVGHKSPTSIAFQPSGGAMRRLQDSLNELLNSSNPLQHDNAELLEKKCLDDLSACLVSDDGKRHKKDLGATRLKLIDQAVNIMNESVQKGLSNELLCDALQINERTLRRIFKHAFGMGPMALYRLIRLNRLRQDLKSARDESLTVAMLAHRYNFKRLGALAKEYQILFGEFPSETLKVKE
jgi:AraC family ethanolamine operon transcriptional activator